MKLRLFNFLIFVIAAVAGFANAKPFTVVIDPGHGGQDAGCVGRIINEKSTVLDVATRLGKLIGQQYPEVKVLYTRSDDRFIPLNDRAKIANSASADLFISIHVNSVDRRSKGREKVHGASVYTLGLHRSDDNLAVAMRENSVIELEQDFSEEYQGFDPNSSESYIIFEMTQNRHMQQSVELANDIQRELVGTAGRADKGVLQSGFLVLRATSMPAVLVELDFICNPEAEDFLASDNGRDRCAQSLANAFSTYYTKQRPRPSAAARTASSALKVKDAPAAPDRVSAYTVVLLKSKNKIDFKNDPRFSEISAEMLREVYADNCYNYTYGQYGSLKQARKALKNIKQKFADAAIDKL